MIKQVICGISGGVDSAVAALILKRKGFAVRGVFMRNWDLTDETGECSAGSDCEDARYVCDKLRVPFSEVNFVKEYWNDVFCELVRGYEEGLTPNPDVLCNKFVKFGHFFRHARERLGADAVATGHYAQNSWGQFLEQPTNDGASLLIPADHWKDQTLFLSQIPQEALQRTMFPVGGLTKDVVRQIARDAGLDRVVRKKEYIEPKPGNFVDIETGKVVGQHKGIHNWTLGQRTYLAGFDKAYFVAAIRKDTPDILVAKGTNHPSLFHHKVYAKSPHWINKPPLGLYGSDTVQCYFRYQHVHPLAPCKVKLKADSEELEILLEKPLRAISPGQYAVLYKDGECLGSGYITGTGPSLYDLNITEPVQNVKGFS